MRPATLAFLIASGVMLGGIGYWMGSRHAALAPAAAQLYHCPMHPTYISDKPGECPICHMTLVPVGERASQAEPALITGRATVVLTPERRQVLGLRSEPVAEKQLFRTLRTVGRVAVDERRLHHVHVKYDGYVEELFVDFTGKYVRDGEPLLAIYSPDLVATQQEYLLITVTASRHIEHSFPFAEPARVSKYTSRTDALAAAREFLDSFP